MRYANAVWGPEWDPVAFPGLRQGADNPLTSFYAGCSKKASCLPASSPTPKAECKERSHRLLLGAGAPVLGARVRPQGLRTR